MGRVYVPAAELATRKPAFISMCSQAKLNCMKVLKKDESNNILEQHLLGISYTINMQTLRFFFFFSENIEYVFHLSALVVEFARALVNAHITDMHY